VESAGGAKGQVARKEGRGGAGRYGVLGSGLKGVPVQGLGRVGVRMRPLF
jgi:hypothetical protein